MQGTFSGQKSGYVLEGRCVCSQTVCPCLQQTADGWRTVSPSLNHNHSHSPEAPGRHQWVRGRCEVKGGNRLFVSTCPLKPTLTHTNKKLTAKQVTSRIRIWICLLIHSSQAQTNSWLRMLQLFITTLYFFVVCSSENAFSAFSCLCSSNQSTASSWGVTAHL